MRNWRNVAIGAAGALAAVAVPVAPALAQAQVTGPTPVVLAARALPGALPAKGGAVEVVGKVRGATTCRVVVLGDHGIKVSLPKPAGCSKGAYRAAVGFGANSTKSAIVVKLGLEAGKARGVFYVVVTPARRPVAVAHPAVLSARATPWQLGYNGGTVTVTGKVSGAKVCRVAVLSDPGVRVSLPKPANCAKGAYSERVTVGANQRYAPVAVRLGLFPYGLVRKDAGAFYVSLGAKPRPKPVVTTPPPATTTPPTTTPPVATGGGAPPVLPSSPPPPPPATTTTTTTAPTTTTTTTAPASPTLTAAASTVQQASSDNWSGYVVYGPQLYTSATGTFTVTSPTSSDTCNNTLGEWVGIDGADGSQNLIQAGVGVYVDKFANGTCDNGHYGVYPWWETISPSSMPPATAIINWDEGPLAGDPATVNIGDTVTVTISQVADSACSPATECWQIQVVDGTTGGAYSIDTPYAGPGSSAEWIVENPDQTSNTNCPDYNGVYLCPMADYTPAVTFSGLSATPDAASGWEDISMTVPGCSGSGCQVISQQSALSTNPSLGFSVSYVAPANAPAMAPLVPTVASKLPSGR